MANPALHPLIEKFRRDHLDLMRRLRSIDHLFEDAARHGWNHTYHVELALLLERLEEHLIDHFTQEEDEGVLREAVANAPQLQREAANLILEHDDLTRRLELVRRYVELASADSLQWRDAELRWYDFATAMRVHDAQENRVVAHGLNFDAAYTDS